MYLPSYLPHSHAKEWRHLSSVAVPSDILFNTVVVLSVIMSWRNMKCIRLFLTHDMTIQSPAQHALGDRSMCNLQAAAAEDYLFGCLLQSLSNTNENIQILLLRWWGAPWSNSPRPLPFNKPYTFLVSLLEFRCQWKPDWQQKLNSNFDKRLGRRCSGKTPNQYITYQSYFKVKSHQIGEPYNTDTRSNRQ